VVGHNPGEAMRLGAAQSLGEDSFDLSMIGLRGRLSEFVIQDGNGRVVTWWSRNSEHDVHIIGDEVRDVVVQGPAKTARRSSDENETHTRRVAGRQLILGREGEQHTALIGAPMFAKELQIAPAAMIGAASWIPSSVNRTTAPSAKVGTANARQLLEFLRIDIGSNAADCTFAALPPVHQFHERYPRAASSHPTVLSRLQATRADFIHHQRSP